MDEPLFWLKSPVELHRLCKEVVVTAGVVLLVDEFLLRLKGNGVARGEGDGIGLTLLEL